MSEALAKVGAEAGNQLRTRLHAVDGGPCYSPGYIPTQRQAEFHAATETHVLFGGAAGPGKSRALREEARAFALAYPNTTQLFLRRTREELRDTHLLAILREWPADSYKHVKGEYRISFPNGSVIIFGHCEHEDSYTRYLSAEYDRICFDELTTFTERQYDEISSRLRAPAGRPYRLQVRSATNPGSIGHAWVKDRWVDRRAARRIRLDRYRFIPARLDDNPHIDPSYREHLEEMPEARRNALLWGSWDSFEGQFFREWLVDAHVVRPFRIPADWVRIFAMDYGSTAPLAGGWLAIDPATQPCDVYLYREHYAAGQLLSWHAAQIAEAEGDEYVNSRVADPSMWARNQQDRGSLAEQCADMGLELMPAINNRASGWTLVHELLAHDWPTKAPRLRVFDTCVETIRSLPTLVHDKRNVEDLDTKGDDHLADMLRYGLIEAVGLAKRPTYTDFDTEWE